MTVTGGMSPLSLTFLAKSSSAIISFEVLYGQRFSVRLDSVTVFYLGSNPSEYHLEVKETLLTADVQ
jgi:hypothetical protein